MMDNGTPLTDAGIIRAFEAGRSAERQDKQRSENPYRPSEADGLLYAAWNAGFDEEDVQYAVA